MTYLMPHEFKAKLARFAAGRISARRFNLGPESRFEERWRPRVAGSNVHSLHDPADGFTTKALAIEAARRFRESCRT